MTTNNNQRVRPPSERRYFANMMVTLGTNQRVRGSLDEKMRALLAASTAAAGGSGSTTGTTGTVADAESDADAGRLEKEKEVLEVYIEKGAPDGHKITFYNKADEQPGMDAGDVHFIVQEKEHPVFKRKQADL